jgi:hypothetical protein
VIVLLSRIGVAPLLEPDDSLVRTRLQKMHCAYPSIPIGMKGPRGSRQIACSACGMTSSIDPVSHLHQPPMDSPASRVGLRPVGPASVSGPSAD